MLNSVLIVGVPMVALLAAAYYVFTRAQANGPQSWTRAHGSGGDNQFPGTTNSRPGSTNRRRRRVVSNHGEGDGHTSSDSPADSGYAEEQQCEICFDNVTLVQLYPCNHGDICIDCMHKILFSNRRCPFCRHHIRGYVEPDSGALFILPLA